jgi:thiosulfate/3-mercaptopyruvate sulfurtransferase
MPDIAGRHLVDTDWLALHMTAPDLVVLDGTSHLPTTGRNAQAEYRQEHIPGALFFDIDAISDEKSPLPHMLPSTVKFASRVKAMGIGDGMRVVVYDTHGFQTAARVWWMFRIMGHEDVAVLDGGLKKWKAEGRPVTDEPTPQRTPRHFTPRFNASLVRDLDDMKQLVAGGAAQIVDARSAGRFEGRDPEPRKGLRGGHMPGARSLPLTSLVRPDGTLKPVPELARAWADAGVNVTRPVVTTCGSGVTAAGLALSMALLGHPDVAVYDGSWSEWGGAEGVPIATGPAG